MVLPAHKVAITKQFKHCYPVSLFKSYVLARKGIRAPVRRLAFIEKHSIIDAASVEAALNSYYFVSVNHYP